MQTQTSNTLHNAIIEAGGKDRPSMLAPGNYIQWKSRIKRYIDIKPNCEVIHYCLKNPPYKYQWADKDVPVTEGSTETTTERYMENYKNVSQDIRDQLNAEAKAVQIILTGIDNDIYSTIDACPNACEMRKVIKRLKQGKSINVQDLETNLYWEFGKFTSWDGESLESYYSRFYKMMNELVRNLCDVTNHQSQELKIVSYHKLYDILKQHQNKVNEIRAERLARTTNPLALIAQQQPVYHPQNHPNHYTQNSSTRTQQAATENRGKQLSTLLYPSMIKNLLWLLKMMKCNVDGDRETEKDAAYPKEKMLLCKQKEAGFQLNAKQANWKDDTDDESEDQELEAHYMYMAQIQEVTPGATDTSGPIFDSEPLQNVSNDDNYNVFAIETEHPEQSKSIHDTYLIEQDKHNVIINSLDMSYDTEQIDHDDDDDALANERDLLASLFEKLKCEIDDTKEAQLKFYKTREDKEIDKVIVLENKIKDLDNIVYKTGQSVQTMSMLNCNCKTSFAKPEFLKKSQRANPHLYDIGCYNDNLALMLAPESDELVEIILFIDDSGCSKHMTRNLKLLTNFVEKFLGTMKFGNDQITPILGYGDLVQGATHFLRSKDETPEVLIDFLRLVQRGLHAQVRIVQTDKGTQFLNKTLHVYFASEGIHHQTSVSRTPKQNGVVERWNCTLIEAARTMLSAAKVPLFFWAEAIAAACFTQNRSLIIPQHEKTPYHIIND
nr:putative ribonuclease H-like domain-containing protein [Tanacetum cinerariifolium]